MLRFIQWPLCVVKHVKQDRYPWRVEIRRDRAQLVDRQPFTSRLTHLHEHAQTVTPRGQGVRISTAGTPARARRP